MREGDLTLAQAQLARADARDPDSKRESDDLRSALVQAARDKQFGELKRRSVVLWTVLIAFLTLVFGVAILYFLLTRH